MEFSRPEYWSGWPFPSPGDLPNPRIEPRSPALQVDSLPAEPQGKLKNTGVGSLSLLQQIFLTQESNWGLLYCRQNLYQLLLLLLSHFSRVQLCATPWAVQSMGFSRPEYWRRVPFSSPGDIPDPGIKPGSPAFQADSLPAKTQGKPCLGRGSLNHWITRKVAVPSYL